MEKAKIIRFPETSNCEFIGNTISIPFCVAPLYAGSLTDIPDSGEDEFAEKIEILPNTVKNPKTTKAFRISGNSMYPLLKDSDVVLVDISEEAINSDVEDKIVVAFVYGEGFSVKRFNYINGNVFLVPINDSYPKIEIKSGMSYKIWGVVLGIQPPLIKI